MSTNTILTADLDTNGLALEDDTTSVAIAFAAVGLAGLSFLAAAALTIANLA